MIKKRKATADKNQSKIQTHSTALQRSTESKWMP